MSLSIINDNLVTPSDLRSKLIQSTASSVAVNVTGATDLSSGFGANNSTYYYCTAAATITLPVASSAYRGKIVHISNHSANTIQVPASNGNTTAGLVKSISGADINPLAVAGTLLTNTAGTWVTLVCDGSAWVAIMAE